MDNHRTEMDLCFIRIFHNPILFPLCAHTRTHNLWEDVDLFRRNKSNNKKNSIP